MKPPLTPPEGENSDIAGELDKAVFLLFVYTILFVIIPQALPIEGADANRRSTPVGAEVKGASVLGQAERKHCDGNAV